MLANANDNFLRVGSGHTGYNAPTKMEFYTAQNNTAPGTRRMLINPFGNIGIGKTGPTEKLDVAGNIKLSGDLLSSDDEIRLRNTVTGAGVVLLANGDVCIGSGC